MKIAKPISRLISAIIFATVLAAPGTSHAELNPASMFQCLTRIHRVAEVGLNDGRTLFLTPNIYLQSWGYTLYVYNSEGAYEVPLSFFYNADSGSSVNLNLRTFQPQATAGQDALVTIAVGRNRSGDPTITSMTRVSRSAGHLSQLTTLGDGDPSIYPLSNPHGDGVPHGLRVMFSEVNDLNDDAFRTAYFTYANAHSAEFIETLGYCFGLARADANLRSHLNFFISVEPSAEDSLAQSYRNVSGGSYIRFLSRLANKLSVYRDELSPAIQEHIPEAPLIDLSR